MFSSSRVSWFPGQIGSQRLLFRLVPKIFSPLCPESVQGEPTVFFSKIFIGYRSTCLVAVDPPQVLRAQEARLEARVEALQEAATAGALPDAMLLSKSDSQAFEV